MGAPVEAATAFANLYQRWFDDARGLAEANRRQARRAVGARVADVLTLWDEHARSWLPGAPTILRLESGDLAAFVMREPCIALHSGRIATDAPWRACVGRASAPARTSSGGRWPTSCSSPAEAACSRTWRSFSTTVGGCSWATATHGRSPTRSSRGRAERHSPYEATMPAR